MTDLEDLRRADGSIDARMIGEGRVETLNDASDPKITPERCGELRRAVRGRNISMIGDEYDADDSVISTHVAGRCSCDVDEPALTYDATTRTWSDP